MLVVIVKCHNFCFFLAAATACDQIDAVLTHNFYVVL